MPSLEPVVDKWQAFGWDVTEIDGHDMRQVLDALQQVQRVQNQPQLVVAHTLKGRGLSPFEKDDVNRKHGKPLDEEDLETALAELDDMQQTIFHAGKAPTLTAKEKYGEVS